MRYPVIITKDGDGFMAKFPDIPEALTGDDTYEETLVMAEDALVTAMDFYFEDRRPVPMPSKPARGQETVELPASVATKVLLLNEILSQKITYVELARRIGIRPQEVQRLVDLGYTSKIDLIEKAFHALGKRLDFKVTAA
ncbi:MAG: type II toxin-antitoxin system HicB family antitoxin [Betaproteobacteria bacterium]|nr:type II toxin-antitoxin system HicB family antitoxin [Betaproteobacteria bacterium]